MEEDGSQPACSPTWEKADFLVPSSAHTTHPSAAGGTPWLHLSCEWLSNTGKPGIFAARALRNTHLRLLSAQNAPEVLVVSRDHGDLWSPAWLQLLHASQHAASSKRVFVLAGSAGSSMAWGWRGAASPEVAFLLHQ